MSDPQFPGTVPQQFPGGPEGDGTVQQPPNTTPSVVQHREYVYLFLTEAFYSGDMTPLKWRITCTDGRVPDTPTAAVVSITPVGGALLATVVPDIEADPEPESVELALLWAVPTAGDYLVEITVTIGPDNQTRSDRQRVTVM